MLEILLEFIKIYIAPLATTAGVIFAFFQLWGARKSRIETTEPKVEVYLDFELSDPSGLVYLVIRNFGKTTAKNIRSECSEEMKMVINEIDNNEAIKDEHNIVKFPESISHLSPGREWRTLVGFMEEIATRDKEKLPKYKIVVEYDGQKSLGKKYHQKLDFTIDFKELASSRLVRPKEKIYKIQPAKTKYFVCEIYDKEKIAKNIQIQKEEHYKRMEQQNEYNTKN